MEAVRKSGRIASKLKTPDEEEVTPAPPATNQATPSTSGLSPGAIRSRRYREKLKQDPERYAAYKKKDRENAKQYRKSMSAEKKAILNKAAVERTRKCREKKKEQGLPLNNKKPKLSTRATTQQEREKARARKAAYRASLNGYQKAWINRKRREARAAKKAQKEEQSVLVSTPPTSSSGYKKPSTKSKAISKALSSLPESPEKFAAVLEGLCNTKSPRKRKALEDKGFLHPDCRKKLKFSQEVNRAMQEEMKAKRNCRSKKDLARRRIICGILAKYAKFRGYGPHLKEYGTSGKFLESCLSKDEFTRKKRKDAVSTDTASKIEHFFEREDISRDDPAQTSVSARTGKSKRFMQKTLKEAFEQYNAQAHDEEKVSFSTFSRLKPITIKATHHNILQTCRCEYCIKVQLRLEAINGFLAKKGKRELTLKNRSSALKMTMCDHSSEFPKIECVERKCTDCGVGALRQHLQPVLEENADTLTEWDVWTLVGEEFRQSDGSLKTVTKWRPIKREGPFDQLVTELEEEMSTFSLHNFNATWQDQQFANLKNDLPVGWLLLVSDYGQNYTCHHQDEIQGAHWSRSEVTLHPVVAYYHTAAEGSVRESFMYLSNDHKHDAHASHCFQMKTVEDLLSRGLTFSRIVQFSDGCASQYKGKTNFVDLSFAEEDTGILTEKHYFGSRHGKGPCDAEIGVLKKTANLAVKRRQAIISNAEGLFEWANRALTKTEGSSRRKIVFINQGQIERCRPERMGSDIRTLPGTRSLHAVRSQSTPYVVTWRKRSCFCGPCQQLDARDCLNENACGPWHVFKMQKRSRPGNPEPELPPEEIEDPQPTPEHCLEVEPTAEEEVEVAARPTDQPALPPQLAEESQEIPSTSSTREEESFLRPGEYVRIKLESTAGRRVIQKVFGAVIMQVLGDDLEVVYLKEQDGFFSFPDSMEPYLADKTQVLGPLDTNLLRRRAF